MFERERHQKIQKLLACFNRDLLLNTETYFGGGTAIALKLGEFRESMDIDFLCASHEGYRMLRGCLEAGRLGSILSTPVKHLRDVSTDRYAIRAVLEMDGDLIKTEIVYEARVTLAGSLDPELLVPVLSVEDLFAQKLLANADRALDRAVRSRDAIDLAMMVRGWGGIPSSAFEKAMGAYDVVTALHQAVGMLSDRPYLLQCLDDMRMDKSLADVIPEVVEQEAVRLPLSERETVVAQHRIKCISSARVRSRAEGVFFECLQDALRNGGSPQDFLAAEKEFVRREWSEGASDSDAVADVISVHSPISVSPARKKALIKSVAFEFERLERARMFGLSF